MCKLKTAQWENLSKKIMIYSTSLINVRKAAANSKQQHENIIVAWTIEAKLTHFIRPG